jgi:uncharacterized membrane protein
MSSNNPVPNGTIRNPVEWSGAQLGAAGHALGTLGRSLHHIQDTIHSPAPMVRRIGIADLRAALAEGIADFKAYRSDVLFVGVIYAVAGLVLARIAFGMDLLPLLFPLASGFALVGPLAAIGLYELSRRREQGAAVTWVNAFDVFRAPAIGAIAVLGTGLVAIFLLWILAAWLIFQNTLGPQAPMTPGGFADAVLNTGAGHAMILIGIGVGFLFAVFAMAISVVSFPLLLDHDVGLDTAVKTSVRAVILNPSAMAIWGAVVAAGLVLGSIPALIGLVVTVPVLGHATWHLYRRVVRV